MQIEKLPIIRFFYHLSIADLFPPIGKELGPYRTYFNGLILNAGAGNRDITPYVNGQVINQDLDIGLHNANIHIYSPLHQIPVGNSHFDTIICNAVLEHVINPTEVMREFARVHKPGGILYLCIPFIQPEHRDPNDYQRYTLQGISHLVTAHGYTVISAKPQHNVYVTLGWIVKEWLGALTLRSILLRPVLFPLLKVLIRTSSLQLPRLASAHVVLAQRQ